MKKLRFGVIPAAGIGNRMGYLSTVLPKCLLPLCGKPIIHYVVENMVRIGIEKIYVIAYSKKELISEHFENSHSEIGAEVEVVSLEELPKGLALSIYAARELVRESFVTILGDDVTVTDSLSPLVDLFFSRTAVAVEGVVKDEDKEAIKRSCCMELDETNRILHIVEKPTAPISSIRGCGVYIFSPEIFHYIEKTPMSLTSGEVEITDTISLLSQEGKAYGGFIHGANFNINTSDDLRKARTLIRNGIHPY